MDNGPIVFEGPNGRLTLDFDPATVKGGAAFDGFPKAVVTFEGIGLRATGMFTFFDHDLLAFGQELVSSHAALSGTAALASEDGDFTLLVTYRAGDAEVSGHLQHRLDDGSKLSYVLATDQSYLGPAVAAFRSFLS